MTARSAVIALVIALAFGLPAAAPAAPAAPAAAATAATAGDSAAPTVTFSWTKRTVGRSNGFGRSGLSCPTPAFCMLVAQFAGNPLTGPLRRLSNGADICTSRRLCLVRQASTPDFVNDDILVSRRPTRRAKRYRRVVKLRGGVHDIACAGERFCAAVGQSASAFSRKPGTRGSWRVRGRADQGQMLTCSAQELCMAVRSSHHFVSVILRPFAPGSRWRTVTPTATQAGDSTNRGACVGESSCLLGIGAGALLSSTHVQDGKTAWLKTLAYNPPGPGRSGIGDAECPSPTFCVALASKGETKRPYRNFRWDLLYSTNPFSGSAADWSYTPLPDVGKAYPSSIDCPSTQMCFISTADYGRDSTKLGLLTARISVGAGGSAG